MAAFCAAFTDRLDVLYQRKAFEQCRETPDLHLLEAFTPFAYRHRVGDFQPPYGRHKYCLTLKGD